jgi:hypothetical protein
MPCDSLPLRSPVKLARDRGAILERVRAIAPLSSRAATKVERNDEIL